MDLEKLTDEELREERDTRARAYEAARRNYMQRLAEFHEADVDLGRRWRKRMNALITSPPATLPVSHT